MNMELQVAHSSQETRGHLYIRGASDCCERSVEQGPPEKSGPSGRHKPSGGYRPSGAHRPSEEHKASGGHRPLEDSGASGQHEESGSYGTSGHSGASFWIWRGLEMVQKPGSLKLGQTRRLG